MIIEICPYCKKKNIYAGKKISYCVYCGKTYNRDECEQIMIKKEPFTECPFCGTKYDQPVTECTAKVRKKDKCGFGYQTIDDAEEIIKMNEEKERKQAEMLECELEHPNIPKCPTCGSTNIHKISTTRKVAGAIGFGLLSRTAKSQFECKNCGYKW